MSRAKSILQRRYLQSMSSSVYVEQTSWTPSLPFSIVETLATFLIAAIGGFFNNSAEYQNIQELPVSSEFDTLDKVFSVLVFTSLTRFFLKTNPVERASIWSKLTFSWLNPLLA